MTLNSTRNSPKTYLFTQPELSEREKVERLVAKLASKRQSLGIQSYDNKPLHSLIEQAYSTLADSLSLDHYSWDKPDEEAAFDAAYSTKRGNSSGFWIWFTVGLLVAMYLLGFQAGRESIEQETLNRNNPPNHSALIQPSRN